MLTQKADYDVTNPIVVLRLMCGLFYVPHILFKLGGMAGAIAFFGKAGFYPPEAFVYFALIVETICAVGLTFNILTKWVGLIGVGTMATAALAVINTKGLGWLWNLGGIEYLVFWGLASLSLAVHAWKQEFQIHGRIYLLFPSSTARETTANGLLAH